MQNIGSLLGEISIEQFLEEYWQKKPLLIRNALADFELPLSPDELAGLACEEQVESRIVLEKDGDYPWQCINGPFEEDQFSTLPDSHWTLLVQGCNYHVPEVAQLLERFNFIPSWRVDDVMISYAVAGGSVGPHTDNYDVFLLQGMGTRRWQISTKPYKKEDFIPDLDLKILNNFEQEQTWELNPGDLLYLPPGVAHYGVALDDCITLSIGFRAPNYAQLSEGFTQHLLENSHSQLENLFYKDPGLKTQSHSGEIKAEVFTDINNLLFQQIFPNFSHQYWFGQFITEIANEEMIIPLNKAFKSSALLKQLKAGKYLLRNEYCKFAFSVNQAIGETNQHVIFFCNGEATRYPPSLHSIIALVCEHRMIFDDMLPVTSKQMDISDFLCHLTNQGCLSIEDE